MRLNKQAGSILFETVAWMLSLSLIYLTFERLTSYLNQTKTLYERIDRERARKIKVDKFMP